MFRSVSSYTDAEILASILVSHPLTIDGGLMDKMKAPESKISVAKVASFYNSKFPFEKPFKFDDEAVLAVIESAIATEEYSILQEFVSNCLKNLDKFDDRIENLVRKLEKWSIYSDKERDNILVAIANYFVSSETYRNLKEEIADLIADESFEEGLVNNKEIYMFYLYKNMEGIVRNGTTAAMDLYKSKFSDWFLVPTSFRWDNKITAPDLFSNRQEDVVDFVNSDADPFDKAGVIEKANASGVVNAEEFITDEVLLSLFKNKNGMNFTLFGKLIRRLSPISSVAAAALLDIESDDLRALLDKGEPSSSEIKAGRELLRRDFRSVTFGERDLALIDSYERVFDNRVAALRRAEASEKSGCSDPFKAIEIADEIENVRDFLSFKHFSESHPEW